MAAKKLDNYMVSRIDSKEYLKKKLLKSVRYKLRYKDFRVGKATVQYGRNSPIYIQAHLIPYHPPLTREPPEVSPTDFNETVSEEYYIVPI